MSNILFDLRYFGGFGVGYGNDPFLDEREIYPEWFEVDKADQCDDVPENVNTGRIRDVCGDVRGYFLLTLSCQVSSRRPHLSSPF